MRPDDLPTTPEREGSGGTLPITGNPEVGIVLALEKGDSSHYKRLAQAAVKFQEETGLPIITQYEIACITVRIGSRETVPIGYIITSPKTESPAGMGEMLPVLVDIDDICRKRNWKRVAVICEPEHLLELIQKLEGTGRTVVKTVDY